MPRASHVVIRHSPANNYYCSASLPLGDQSMNRTALSHSIRRIVKIASFFYRNYTLNQEMEWRKRSKRSERARDRLGSSWFSASGKRSFGMAWTPTSQGDWSSWMSWGIHGERNQKQAKEDTGSIRTGSRLNSSEKSLESCKHLHEIIQVKISKTKAAFHSNSCKRNW